MVNAIIEFERLASEEIFKNSYVTWDDIMGNGRHRFVVEARENIVAGMRNRPIPFSYPVIAQCMNRPSHSACIAMYQRWLRKNDLVEELA